MPVSGQEIVIKNIKKFGDGFKNHVKKVMSGAVEILDERITKNMSLMDHSLQDLAVMGHPYAKRHGEHGLPIHDPYWSVHKQTGKLISSKFKGVSDVDINGMRVSISGYVGLDSSVADYASSVIWGTSKMIPRDFLGGSLFQKDIQEKLREHFKNNLRDAVASFKGDETKS